MAIAVSHLHCLTILLLVINAVVGATVASISNRQVLTVSYPVDFTVKLDVDQLNSEGYRKFITEFRSQLAKGGQYSGTVPILPNYGNDPHLFDVVLTTSNHQVTVRGRRDNLYIRGYLMQTPKQWMEFKEEDVNPPRHMVSPDSQFLDFGDKYSQMEAAMNPPGTPASKMIKVTDLPFTKTQLADAVAKLATSTNKMERARSLIYMAQMLSEAARFVDVANFFGSQLFKGEHLPIWMRTLENDWGKYSKVVQCSHAYSNYKFTQVTINGVEYKTAAELRSIFGIMLKEANILIPKTCGIKNLRLEDEGGAVAALLFANI